MLADAMPPEPEVEEDDQTPTDDDLRRRRPIPVNVPPLGSADDLQTQPVLRASPSASRAIPVGAEEADASEPQETVPIIRPAGSRAIPTSTDTGRRLRAHRTRATPIPAFNSGDPGFQPGGVRAIPIGSTEDLESRIAPRPLPSGRAIPITPGSTEDLEDRSLQTFEHPKSAPIQTGVASLWTKAENIHNPILRVLGEIGAGGARALDVAGQAVGRVIPAVGAVESAIPGTTMNAEAKGKTGRKTG